MNIPRPTPIYRIIHVDNLAVCLKRGGFHAPNNVPDDGLKYRTIHNVGIQNVRRQRTIPCGPRGTMHDYVPFYFGPRSPMLLQLHTGEVNGYHEGQEPIIYIVTTVEKVLKHSLQFVFSDGQGIKAFTTWYDNLKDLNRIDWEMVYADYWADTLDDMDRQRRKQAEFLIYQFCPIEAVTEIGVLNNRMKQKVETILQKFGINNIPVNIHRDWYY
ncbi:hypothetical protein Calab_0893 [Caldithrix abyssi DSM 13497]|uniref:DarT domain-containing protein n=1 Tax=Caldithrix abyssi DSM 13497 TaxID=880073 RepID=H1XUN1_CALAY|nr:DUF4433 domain-containing protein [Caldithrix abyssi]APF16812.1 protein of unknown function (DUF4433) [Caldithrix abyssi DSM 13497]EHO40530.1 hypothetical protein Calab_0893 [Caldithrix abyssi DSM 13497]